MTDPKTPAFPRSYVADGHNGMTLRDYFAGQALPAAFNILCAAPKGDYRSLADKLGSPKLPVLSARMAYAVADAMLAERDKS